MSDFQPYLQSRTPSNRKQDPTTEIEGTCISIILSTEDGHNQGFAKGLCANGLRDYQWTWRRPIRTHQDVWWSINCHGWHIANSFIVSRQEGRVHQRRSGQQKVWIWVRLSLNGCWQWGYRIEEGQKEVDCRNCINGRQCIRYCCIAVGFLAFWGRSGSIFVSKTFQNCRKKFHINTRDLQTIIYVCALAYQGLGFVSWGKPKWQLDA